MAYPPPPRRKSAGRKPSGKKSGRRRSSQKSSTLLVVGLAVGIPLGLMLVLALAVFVSKALRDGDGNNNPFSFRIDTPGARRECRNNLKQIGIALHNYHDVHGTFPPAYVADENGKPMHSWRVLILPYLDQKPLYDRYRFDEPWNSPHNRRLASHMPDVFRCPSAKADAPMTHYVTLRSGETMFPGTEAIRFADIPDGTSNTVMVVEYAGEPVNWMAPDDVQAEDFVKSMQRLDSDEHHHRDGTHFLVADGSVRLLKSDTPQRTLTALTTRSGGEVVDMNDF